jgi:dCMP deaminase
MANQLDKVDTFIELAQVWAKRSTCSSRVAVGAVLVNEFNQVISSGYNGSPRGMVHCNDVGCHFDSDNHCIRAIHAEENVILQCALNGVSTRGSFLYVTHSPCPKCALRIVQAGIVSVIYQHVYGSLALTQDIFHTTDILFSKVPK